MLIDTHCHLYSRQFDADRDHMIQRAFDAGVGRLYLPNVDSQTVEGMLALEARYPGRCFPMMGLHPCDVKENYEQELQILRDWLDQRSFCAVGEIGLDYYWSKENVEQQKLAFRTQINWAKEFDIPIVIHARESIDDNIAIVKDELTDKLRGVFHCFTGTVEQAKKIIDMGFFLGIGGVLTFKNGGIEPVVTEIPLEYLVLETDAPYLAPIPFRGKRNESAYITHVAARMAELRGITVEEVEEATTQNALRLFGI